MGILALGERQRVRLFIRRDPFERFVSCLVFLPRDRFNTRNRERVQEHPRRGLRRRERRLRAAPVRVGARAHPPHAARPARRRCRPTTAASSRSGSPRRPARGATSCARRCWRRSARSRAPRCTSATATRSRSATAEDWLPRSAVVDIRRIEQPGRTRDDLAVAVYRPLEARRRRAALQALPPRRAGDALGGPAAASRTWACRCATSALRGHARATAAPTWIYDFGVGYTTAGGEVDVDELRERFQEAFVRVWRRRGRERPLQRAGARRRAGLARRDRAARRSPATCARRPSPSASATWPRR